MLNANVYCMLYVSRPTSDNKHPETCLAPCVFGETCSSNFRKPRLPMTTPFLVNPLELYRPNISRNITGTEGTFTASPRPIQAYPKVPFAESRVWLKTNRAVWFSEPDCLSQTLVYCTCNPTPR